MENITHGVILLEGFAPEKNINLYGDFCMLLFLIIKAQNEDYVTRCALPSGSAASKGSLTVTHFSKHALDYMLAHIPTLSTVFSSLILYCISFYKPH